MRNFIKPILAFYLLLPTAVHAQLRLPSLFEAEQQATLSANQAGTLTTVEKRVGDKVRRGDLLFSLDSSDLESDLKLAKIGVTFAEQKLKRQRQLQKRGMASPAALADAQQERDMAKAEQAQLRQKIKRSKRYAPYSGVVLERSAQPQEWVEAGQPVLSIVNTQQLRLSVAVPSRALASLQAESNYYAEVPALARDGQVIQVELTLKAIAPWVEPQSDTAEVILRVNNPPQGLLAGMRGELLLNQPGSEPLGPKLP